MSIKIFVELRVKIIPIKYITLKKKKISFEEIKTSRSIASGIRTRIVSLTQFNPFIGYFFPKSYDSFSISFQHNQQTKQRIVITSKSVRKKKKKREGGREKERERGYTTGRGLNDNIL